MNKMELVEGKGNTYDKVTANAASPAGHGIKHGSISRLPLPRPLSPRLTFAYRHFFVCLPAAWPLRLVR